MKTSLRALFAGLAVVAMAAAGCIITSAQIFTHFDLPNPFIIDNTTNPFERIVVDLNTVSEYADNKDKLKGLTDVAFGGKFTNLAGPAGGVEVWMTRDVTNYATPGQITSSAIKLWGAETIGASGTAEGTRTLTWDESSALFNTPGRDALVEETKGDGTFTIYTLGTAGSYRIQVDSGTLLLTLDAGK